MLPTHGEEGIIISILWLRNEAQRRSAIQGLSTPQAQVHGSANTRCLQLFVNNQ